MSDAISFSDIAIKIYGEVQDATSMTVSAAYKEALSAPAAWSSVSFKWTCGMTKKEWALMMADRSHYRCRHRRRIVRERQLSRMMRKDHIKSKRRLDSHRRCYNEVTIECSSFAYTDDGLELKGAKFI